LIIFDLDETLIHVLRDIEDENPDLKDDEDEDSLEIINPE